MCRCDAALLGTAGRTRHISVWNPRLIQLHAPRSQSAPLHPRPLPFSARCSCGALCQQGTPGKLPRRRLVERGHASCGRSRPRGQVPRLHRAHRSLEGHIRGPQLGRVQAGKRHHLEPLRRGRLGAARAQQRLGTRRALVRRCPARAGRCARPRSGRAHSKSQSGDRGLQLQQFRRLSHLARPEQQHLHRDGAARRASTRGHAACQCGRQGLPPPSLSRADRQRHRHRSLALGFARREAGLGRGHRSQLFGPGRRPRPAPSRRQAAGLRSRRHR
jgi:hypothetical protein